MKMNSNGLSSFSTSMLKVFPLAAAIGMFATQSQAGCISDPYFIPGSWDLQTPGSGRFDALSNLYCKGVLDRNTGLVWEQSPAAATYTWQGALDHCATMLTGDVMGWRLPTVEELGSLVTNLGFSLGSGIPATQYGLPSGHPFSGVSATFWSATGQASNSSNAWSWQQPFSSPMIGISNGSGIVFPPPVPIGSSAKSSVYRAWCVRGGRS